LRALWPICATLALPCGAAPQRFEFTPGGNAAAHPAYDASRGFGFEPDNPQRFSVQESEGSYRVTVWLGDKRAAGDTTILAEQRRLMLENVHTARRELARRSFIINVRTPQLATPPPNAPGGSSVRLKARELGSLNWDDRLTLEFGGAAPQVSALEIERVTVPTLYLAGDSTVTDQAQAPGASWGQMLPRYFAPDIVVANHAESGETLKSFVTELRLDKLLSTLAAGDWVMIQFGHNDAGGINQEPPGSTRPLRARGTIPGIGNESEEIDNVVTGKHETVYTFGWYLRKMIADTRARGATPILFTITKTNHWHEGRVTCPSDTYRLWTWQTAVGEKVAFVDLSRIIADRYQRQGPEAVTVQFIEDTTHTNIDGAEANAADVVAGLRSLRGLKFDGRLSKAGRKIKADAGQSRESVCPVLP